MCIVRSLALAAIPHEGIEFYSLLMSIRLIKEKEIEMIFWILVALVVYYVHLFLPSMIRIPQIGVTRYVGSRDDLPVLPAIGQRAERAHNNLRENIIPFVALALLGVTLGDVSATAILGAQVFVLARVVYLLCYLFAVPWLRSLVWTIGFVGLVLMAWPLLG